MKQLNLKISGLKLVMRSLVGFQIITQSSKNSLYISDFQALTNTINHPSHRLWAMNRFFQVFVLLVFTCFNLYSQIGIDEWRTHLPTNSFDWAGELSNGYYVVNRHGALKYDPADNSIFTINKITGLSGVGISAFACSYDNGICLAGYEDGNIDIITDRNNIINQRAILNSSILGDKVINDITIYDDLAYISTGIGIVIMELQDYNILDYVSITKENELTQFYECFIHNDHIYASTSDGVKSLPMANLYDFNAPWKSIESPENSSIRVFFSAGDSIYAVNKTGIFNNDSLLVLQDSILKYSTRISGVGINQVTVAGDSLIVTEATSINLYDLNFNQTGSIFTYGEPGMFPSESILLRSGEILVADRLQGGAITTVENQFNSTIISSNSPNSAQIGRTTILNNKLYAMASGSEFSFLEPILHELDGDEWSSTLISTTEAPSLRNINGVANLDEGLFLTTNGEGAVILDDKTVSEYFNTANSSIQDAVDDPSYNYLGVTDMVKDSDDNICILNTTCPEPLVVRYSDGTWGSFAIGLNRPRTNEIILLSSGLLAISTTETGIVIYDFNDTPQNPADDQFRVLSTDPTSGNLPSNFITAIAEDMDGELWIGTNAGISVIYNPENVFSNNFDGAQRIIVNQDGYNGYLLETELVDAIAVDGDDRKWIGTATSGLFLVSSDGTEEIKRFTEDDSPLLSNKIEDIDIMPNTGEVFITTENGLISYRSDATESKDDLEEMLIFPNPVRSGHDGPIAINNLSDDTAVRITTSSGELVYETRSLGGQATWNGRNLNGERIQSGVYLVYATKADGSQGKVGKILFMR